MSAYATNLALVLADAPGVAWREGLAWYPTARANARRLARENGVTLAQACGVIAALSPRVQWEVNLRWAETCLSTGTCNGMSRNVAKAERIVAGERPLSVLGGLKVRAFYRSLMGADDAVCIDVWAARAANPAYRGGTPTPRQYAAYADAYATVAPRFGLTPVEAQAVAWVAIRGRA